MINRFRLKAILKMRGYSTTAQYAKENDYSVEEYHDLMSKNPSREAIFKAMVNLNTSSNYLFDLTPSRPALGNRDVQVCTPQSTVGQRIRMVRAYLNMDKSSFAVATTLCLDTVTDWEQDQREPKVSKLVNHVCKPLGVSADYLLFGNGQMFIN